MEFSGETVAIRFFLFFSILLCCYPFSNGNKVLKPFNSERNVIDGQQDEIRTITCSCTNYSVLCEERPELRLCSGESLQAIRLVDDLIRIYTDSRSSFNENSFDDSDDIDDEASTVTVGNDYGNRLILGISITVISCFGLGVIAIRRAIKNGYFDRFSVNARSNASNAT